MLQRLLLAGGRCATLGEGSLLLRFLGNEDEVIARRATYWESLVDAARSDMRKACPEFDAIYRDGVRALMEPIYAALASGKDYFVDKTPRYSLIADEIARTFPEAKIIVLWRHPLAVASSMCRTFRRGRWCPDEFGIDLEEGFARLRAFADAHRDRICEIRYEDLLEQPAETMAKVGAYLGLPGLDEVATAELPRSTGGRLGDPTGVKRFTRVDCANAGAWLDSVDNWFRRRWCRRYWRADAERAAWMEAMGYGLPEELSRSSGSPASWWAGLVDFASGRIRVWRRIDRPTWLPRFSRRFRRRRGFGVLFR